MKHYSRVVGSQPLKIFRGRFHNFSSSDTNSPLIGTSSRAVVAAQSAYRPLPWFRMLRSCSCTTRVAKPDDSLPLRHLPAVRMRRTAQHRRPGRGGGGGRGASPAPTDGFRGESAGLRRRLAHQARDRGEARRAGPGRAARVPSPNYPPADDPRLSTGERLRSPPLLRDERSTFTRQRRAPSSATLFVDVRENEAGD